MIGGEFFNGGYKRHCYFAIMFQKYHSQCPLMYFVYHILYSRTEHPNKWTVT